MNKGFVSTSLVYSFLIIFLLLMLSITAAFISRDKMIRKVIDEVKSELIIVD